MGSILGNVAGAVVGGLMSDDGGSQQTNTKEPWAPAIKPLTNTLETGQRLERYYQQNPFNQLQRQGYQNLFSDLDQFRNQLSPNLMNFANDMMGYGYQRGPRQSQMEAMQGQMPMQNTKQPMLIQQGSDGVYQTKPMQMQGGLAGGMGGVNTAGMSGWQDRAGSISGMFGQGGAQAAPNSGLAAALGGIDTSGMANWQQNAGRMGDMAGSGGYFGGQPVALPAMGRGVNSGAFQPPTPGNYGLLDFAQLNPFTATGGIAQTPEAQKPAEKTPAELAEEERRRRQMSGEGFRGEGA